jgi:lipid II:glycine glycyltransferase (peptidoglycan interpeptide bridge formation enzyme)
MNEKQMQALIKKMEKAAKPSGKPARWVDPTLKATDADEGANLEDAKEIFKEMKKREF